MRRQNSSCDQCRKGKRACDAGAVKDLQLCLDAELQWEVGRSFIDVPVVLWSRVTNHAKLDWKDVLGPCSNCRKTKKSCTFDWVRSQQLQIRERRQSFASETHPTPSRKRIKSTHDHAALSSEGILGWDINYDGSFQTFTSDAANLLNDPGLLALSEPVFEPSSYGNFTLSPINDTASNESFAEDLSLIWPASESTSSLSCTSDALPEWDDFTTNPLSHVPHPTTTHHQAAARAAEKSRKRPAGQRRRSQKLGMMSEFSPTQRMMDRTNGGLLTDNLMRLYHDVMEGALACWLTEQNCPYLGLSSSSEDGASDMSLGFPNRIYRRVIRLDRSLGALGIKPLAPSEDRKAARALHVSIMAFTAQWAQGSRRSRARYRSPGDESVLSGMVEEFDEALQVSLWNQARRALDDCAEVDSFKLAFAELVFGLTQKYVADTEDSGLDTCIDVEGRVFSEQIRRAFDKDHNLYLERAARRLHVLKRRSECYEKRAATTQSDKPGKQRATKAKGSEEKRTMELIFWLAVMFDTLSAAITERPVTVSDEESQENGTVDLAEKKGNMENEKPGYRWNDRVIIKRHQKLAPLRWPCPEDSISRELRDAAPVKVLLFRKITRLQTLSTRGARGPAIEDAIEDALSVYRHWNMTYGPLFQDCIQHHSSLPSKVQSWYVCLLGHWLLAAMILSDCVALADEQGLGVEAQAQGRTEADLVASLRETSSRMVSDLARVSAPQECDVGSFSDLHPAIYEGAVLTEPWTMVLIRSFAMGGTLLLHEATEFEQSASSVHVAEDLFSRCEDCIKALWYLGRKSSLSRQVAGMLASGLQEERLKLFGFGAHFTQAQRLAMSSQFVVM
ncbi:C6 zinc finger domain-containing protein [Colletotrichum sojae]|uniref:C6 zinc finger domain-containing protein n=1 Tax=Colletotrichum sojae TaxID=2175907 RepID=A0A8H6JNB0_9PEZI|nr:C6 zinc finger domain-containing protein [Colletotrichum sojae]